MATAYELREEMLNLVSDSYINWAQKHYMVLRIKTSSVYVRSDITHNEEFHSLKFFLDLRYRHKKIKIYGNDYMGT